MTSHREARRWPSPEERAEMFRKQRIAIAFSVPAMIVVAAVLLFWRQLTTGLPVPIDDPASRLAFAVQWLVWPGMTLLAGIFGASRRGFYEEAIEGTRTPAPWTLEVNLRYNTNTVEQVLLAAIAWLGLAASAPVSYLSAIPVMAVLFVLGRVAFWVGYAINPLARTFGMTLSALPTILAYGYLMAQYVQ